MWDSAKATKQQLRIRRAGQLVVFFGDNSFGWFPRELLVDFVEHLEEKAKQRTGNKARGVIRSPAAQLGTGVCVRVAMAGAEIHRVEVVCGSIVSG